LDLSHNELAAPVSLPISLNELKLGHNLISEVKPRTWSDMNSLLYLELQSNLLGDTLGSGSFTNLNTLRLVHSSPQFLFWQSKES
jgi:Leucine-rich repeat (LRR) protein